jgi:hypothetical protein
MHPISGGRPGSLAMGSLLLALSLGCCPLATSRDLSKEIGFATLEWRTPDDAGSDVRHVFLGRCVLLESVHAELVSTDPGDWQVQLTHGSGGCLVFTAECLRSHDLPGDDLESWVVIVGWSHFH